MDDFASLPLAQRSRATELVRREAFQRGLEVRECC